MKRIMHTVLVSGLVALAACAAAGSGVTSAVNPFIGAAGDGHCFPAAAYPFGIVAAGPDTGWGSWKYCSGYVYDDKTITMFSQTHNPGGGCPDYADIGILPGGAESPYDKASERAEPGYYAVTLSNGSIRVEATATERCAFYRIGYGATNKAELLVDLDYGMGNTTWAKKTVKPLQVMTDRADCLSGHLFRNGFVKGRNIGFDIRFSKAPVSREELPPPPGGGVHAPKFRYTFDLSDGSPLLVKIALSTVSGEGASKNLAAELPDWDFDRVRRAAQTKWDEILSRVQLADGTDADTRTLFYTSLYRMFHAPVNIADVDGAYRGGDDKIGRMPSGRYYSELSLWDTFRGAHPFYSIIAPEYVPDFVNSMLAHAAAVGYLPVLPKWGKDSQCMIATHAVAVIADAYFKGFKGVDWESAYQAIRNTLREKHAGRHKEDWDLLDRYGYYPCDKLKGEGVSRTLECAYDDWCAARMASALGHAEDAAFFEKRAGNWRNVLDPKTGFMRGRRTDGGWREPFDPYRCGHETSWAGDFTEGNAWQWRWHVLHDPEGLIAALGGKEKAAALLEELFSLPSDLDKSHTSPDVTGLLGQYVQGNEPSHHIPYLYQYVGRPDLAASRIRQLCRLFYRNAPDGLCGNEDHGEMSAWYVFACLGFYPLNPSSGEFVIGAPQVRGATIRLSNGNTFTIVAKGLSEKNKYVKSVMLNGRKLDGFVFRYADVMKGGTLVFEMTDTPGGSRSCATAVTPGGSRSCATAVSPTMENLLDSYVSAGRIAGVVSVLSDADYNVQFDCVGWAERGKRKMTPDTLFAIFSMTKTFTGATLMCAIDDGKLSLDDEVAKYLPEFADVKMKDGSKPNRPLTIRHLTTHTTGWRGGTGVVNRDIPLRDVARQLAARPLSFQPGETFAYGNAWICTAAACLEKAVGKPYEVYLKERVLDPLGMKDTTFTPNAEQLTRLVCAYTSDDKPLRPAADHCTRQLVFPKEKPVFPAASGGLFSTPRDMIAFSQMLAHHGEWKGRTIISRKTFDLVFSVKQTPPGIVQPYTCGSWLYGDWFGHEGAMRTDQRANLRTGHSRVFFIQTENKAGSAFFQLKKDWHAAADKIQHTPPTTFGN